jgi:hypothetical protein
MCTGEEVVVTYVAVLYWILLAGFTRDESRLDTVED